MASPYLAIQVRRLYLVTLPCPRASEFSEFSQRRKREKDSKDIMGGTIPPSLKALVLLDSRHFCSYSVGNNYSASHLDRRDAGKRMLGDVAPGRADTIPAAQAPPTLCSLSLRHTFSTVLPLTWFRLPLSPAEFPPTISLGITSPGKPILIG